MIWPQFKGLGTYCNTAVTSTDLKLRMFRECEEDDAGEKKLLLTHHIRIGL
jgi:hypothetical protein